MPGNEPERFRDKLGSAYDGKTVLVTGHTGFKGAWLSEWLLKLGARVVGVGLDPPTDPALFYQLGLADRLEHHIQDIRDESALTRLVLDAEPDYVFHLAAQSLVRTSYEEPVETYSTNVMGTVHLLEALRHLQTRYCQTQKVCASVEITTDKCYQNREWVHAYRETDAMGGYDPYSSSKACAELAIASFRESFFNPDRAGATLRIGMSSARAGNVIGGGDWARDRIVPDCVRALQRGEPIGVRNPVATRPWQHVFEPLAGYLLLAIRQRQALEEQDLASLRQLCSAFNFGPAVSSNRSVAQLVEEILKHWPGHWNTPGDSDAVHEAKTLNLASDKAFHVLNWQPVWGFEETVLQTIRWYQMPDQSDEESHAQAEVSIREFENVWG